MGKFDNMAILTDLDRTFLGTETKIVQRNVDAIEYFKSEGGIFSIATGRKHQNIDMIIPNCKSLVNGIAIMCNGTYFYDFDLDRVFSEIFMDGAVSYEAIKLVREKHKTAMVRVSNTYGYLIDSGDIRARETLGHYGDGITEEVAFENWNVNGWYKFVVCDKAEVLNKVERTVSEAFSGVFECNRSADYQLEFQMAGTNKGTLYESFKEYYQKRGKQLKVYVCGDNENDVAILKKADVASCPSNAIPEVKEICHKCLCSNDEGVIADLIYSL